MTAHIINEEIGLYELLEHDAYKMFYDSVGPRAMDFGMSYITGGDTTQFACTESPNASFLNRVLGVGLNKPATPEMIDLAVRRARTLKVSCTIYDIENLTRPSNLGYLLQQRGFSLKNHSCVVFYDNTPGIYPPMLDTGHLTIREVKKSQAELFADVTCEGFEIYGGLRRVWEALARASVGHPRQLSFMAYIDDKPAGGVTLVFAKDGKSAGIYSSTTMPEFRHHGVQISLLRTALEEALKRGARVIYGQTPCGGGSQRNLERIGFRVAYTRDHYKLPRVRR